MLCKMEGVVKGCKDNSSNISEDYENAAIKLMCDVIESSSSGSEDIGCQEEGWKIGTRSE